MLKRLLSTMLLPAAVVAFTPLGQAQAAGPAGQAPAASKAAPAAAVKGPRPEQFTFAPLAFKPPRPSDHRTVLSNGMVVYIVEDHEIPWFQAEILSPVAGPGGGGFGPRGVEAAYDPQQRPGGGGGGGVNGFLEPKDKLGILALTSTIMRTGGTATMSGEAIDERMEFLAGTVTSTSLSIHARHVDEGLKIWMDVLQNPAFPEDKLRREKERILIALRNRNRNITTVATRTFNQLVYGEASPITAEATEAITNGITRDDLAAWHRKYWGSNNAILVVAGDFRKAEMLKKLEATFGGWKAAEKAAPVYPKVEQAARAGVYMVQPQGATPNQGIIRIGHVGLTRDDPDWAAVDLMNYTLGGGSFSSRITQIVRNDNGLAYSTSSSFSPEIHYPGVFSAFCQTKNSTVVFAAQLMMNEIERMRAGDVTEKDLRFAKTARVNAFPSMFSTAFGNIRNFAELEIEKRPMDYYDTYVSRYEKVTLADIKRVAQKYLQADRMIIMVAGNIEECKAGADQALPNQATIDAMAARFGGRTIDGLAKKYGDGLVHVVELK
ncbi:MAG TPA: pitrilysin family protein [Vicinamibacterales bacterium]|nr:pitrilysin family protein [Vicinamibacterales bacterium]